MSRRSSRAAERKVYHEPDEDDIPAQETVTSSRKRAAQKTATPRSNKARKLNFDPDFLFTNPRSCLVTADLTSILTIQTWDLLTPEEQRECLALLPDVDKTEINGQQALNHDFFTHNILLQDSIRDFQDRLDAGYMMPSHVKKTIDASRDRLAGKADAFKDEQFERFWGEKQKLDSTLIAGQTTSLTLPSMITSKVFLVGDVFQYSRTFQQGKKRIAVEKDCNLIRISDEGEPARLTFSIPSGDNKYFRDNDQGVTVEVNSLAHLETSILDTDAKIGRGERPNGNSWKTFRLKRKVNDLGSLFEVRERAYHIDKGI